MKTLLVTGSEGFVGGYLTKAICEDSYNIVATCYPLLLPKKGDYVALDILDLEMTREVLKEYNPDIIFHLAAVTSVDKSFRDPPLTYHTNIIGTANILEAVKLLNKNVRFLFVSTCEVYGGGEHLIESSEVVLKNPYAVSKYAAELVCRDYLSEQIEIVILRPFNHTGPGQVEDFVLPTIAKQIAEIEMGKRPPLIEHGNINVKREFINIYDVIEAYRLAIEKGQSGEIYNISSNQGYTLADVLDIFKKLSKVKFELKSDPSRVRKIDIPILIGDGTKFSELTGWQSKIKIEKTIEDLLNYWRAKV
jgi:GDP-4-dehydro-6-deoxy-D-mannose reductase